MAVAIPWLRAAFVSIGLMACSPQVVDAVSGVSCCDDPGQPGCGGSGGAHSSGGAGGSGAAATGGTLATGGVGTAGSAGAPATLVHRYTFQGEGINVTDSVGTAHGNVFGAMLDGTGAVALTDATPEQYVELPNFILSGLKSASFEAWVTWNGGGPWQRIFDFGEDLTGFHGNRSKGRSYLFCTADDGSGHPKVTFGRPGPNNAALEPTMVVGKVAIEPGTQTQVVVVVADKSISLFVNGGFQGSAKFDYSLDYVYDINSWLGRSNFSADPGFDGTIHDFRIYDGALDANQILDDYTRERDTGL